MSFSLKNHIALITGASSGIGEQTAYQFAETGARLILTGRNSDRLQAVARKSLEKGAPDVLPLILDVSDRKAVADRLGTLPDNWKAVDILVNNAGVALGKDPVYRYDADEIERMVDTNIKGLLYVTLAILPGMVERNRGHVVNMGSTAGHDVYPGGSIYNATKFAVNALNQGMKMDLTGTAIRVSSIDPGMVNTHFSTTRFRGDKKKADDVYADMTPLVAEDIADAILWVVTRPSHVNINQIIMMPTDQSSNSLVSRGGKRLFS